MCPSALVRLDMVLESHLGVPCGLDLKSKSLVIKSFSVGSRAGLLSEAGFEKVFRTQNWVRRSKLFCR